MATRWLLFGLSILATPTLALDYWVDSSCAAKFGDGVVDSMIDEAVDTANLVLSGLMNQDSKMQDCFRQIFKFDFDNPGAENQGNLETWQGVMAGQGGVTKMAKGQSGEFGRTSAHLLVYCENEEHFKLRLDNQRFKLTTRNQDKPVDQRDWVDKLNSMVARGARGHERESTAMLVSGGDVPTEGMQDGRCTMDICESFIKEHDFQFNLWPKNVEQPKGFYAGALYLPGITLFGNIGSNVILHELTHAVLPRKYRTNDHAYMWPNLIKLIAEMAVANADSYSYLGTCARMFERGFSLTPDGTGEFVRDGTTARRDVSAVRPDSGLMDLLDIRAPQSKAVSNKRWPESNPQWMPMAELV